MTVKEIIDRAVQRTMAMGVPASRSRLAQLMGVSRTSITQWAMGQVLPDPVHTQKLAELAGVELQEVEEAVWQAKRARFQRRYRSPHVALSRLRKGLARVTRRRGHPIVRAHAHVGESR